MSISIGIGGDGTRYLFRGGKGVDRRAMHIMRFTVTGQHTGEALCGIDYPFTASINAPWGLGRPVCKNCRAIRHKGVAR